MPTELHAIAPLRILQGDDCLAQLAKELDRTGSGRAVIVCGATLARDGSALALVRDALGGKLAGIFSGVRPHSPRTVVEAGAEALRQHRADAVIAVGGGSAIVTARAACILLAEGRDIRELATSRDATGRTISPKLLAPKLPQLVVPSTPTTAMVKAGSAVFDAATGARLALFDPKTRASAIFLHRQLMASAPVQLLVTASLNTFSGAIEGLMSRSGDPISDAELMHAVRLLAKGLADTSRLADPVVRSDLMFAAVLCGRGTDRTGAGLIATLGHSIGARFHVENGIANLIVMPHALRFNAEANPAGLAKIGAALGLASDASGAPLERIVEAVESIAGSLAVPRRLRDSNVPREALASIAEHAMGDWFLRQNPRPVREAAELVAVLEAAW